MKLYRQGDILLQEVSSLPVDLVAIPRADGKIVLAKGEATGHAHTISDAECVLFAQPAETGAGTSTHNLARTTWLTIRKAFAMLDHEEHDALIIPCGQYRVIRQREFDRNMIRMVAD